MLSPVFRLDTPATLGLQAVAFTLHGLDNHHHSPQLQRRLQSLRRAFDPSHSLSYQHGFQSLRQILDHATSSYPPSPQTLFEQNRRHGQLRSISPLVDLYNQWSLNSGLSIVAYDLQRVQLPVRLALTRGGEIFNGLGSPPSALLPAGEYAYFDAANRVLCRMEHRQAAASAVQAHTSAALIIVQGHAATPANYLRNVAEVLKADLLECCGRVFRRAG